MRSALPAEIDVDVTPRCLSGGALAAWRAMRGAAVLVSTGGSFSFVPGVAAAGGRVFVSPYLAGDERLDRRYAELQSLVHWTMWPSFATIPHETVDDYATFDYNASLAEVRAFGILQSG